jgi:hypothetical protein
MDIARIHAYSVHPQRNVSPMRAPEGGAIKPTSALSEVLATNLEEARFANRPSVVFNVDTTTRTSDVRDGIMNFAFGQSAQARAACLMLANRLGAAMDQRSSAALLLLVAFGKESSKRQTVLWIFPNEEAFQFRRSGTEPSIEVLQDVFSQRSKLRKAAMFEGRNSRSDYLEGRILDLQAGSRKQDVAEFFIRTFLDSTLSVTSDIGSRILAETLRSVHEHLTDPHHREQLYASIIAVRNAPRSRISLETFADHYLAPELRGEFLDYAPNQETAAAVFEFSRQSFDDVLQFRVFELENGLYVYSPLGEIGRGVRIADGHLVCEGTIEKEKLRTRHA